MHSQTIQGVGEFQKKYSLGQDDYDALLTALDDTVLVSVTDNKGNIVFANQAFTKVSQYSLSELLGQNHRILKSGDQPNELFDDLWATISSGKVWRGEIKNKAKNGTYYWVDTSIVPIFCQNNIKRYISVRFLITDKKQLESHRDDFLAIATHELKTPITSIKAYAQVLKRRFIKANDNNSAELLEKMDNQINKLTKLVGDFLYVSKIETGKLEYNRTEFYIASLAKSVAEELNRTTDRHKIKIIGTIKHKIIGDEYRISQVLTNLLDNAIKYSPVGTKITVELKDINGYTRIGVHDEGIGINKTDQQKIFRRFFRASGAKASPGFGLGLYISSEIIKNHQGKMWTESKLGKGSTFYFTIPKEKLT